MSCKFSTRILNHSFSINNVTLQDVINWWLVLTAIKSTIKIFNVTGNLQLHETWQFLEKIQSSLFRTCCIGTSQGSTNSGESATHKSTAAVLRNAGTQTGTSTSIATLLDSSKTSVNSHNQGTYQPDARCRGGGWEGKKKKATKSEASNMYWSQQQCCSETYAALWGILNEAQCNKCICTRQSFTFSKSLLTTLILHPASWHNLPRAEKMLIIYFYFIA